MPENIHDSNGTGRKILSQSKISDEPAEGLYLRIDQGDWLVQRVKLIRTSFVQSIGEHWSRSANKLNQLNPNIREHPS